MLKGGREATEEFNKRQLNAKSVANIFKKKPAKLTTFVEVKEALESIVNKMNVREISGVRIDVNKKQ